MPQPPAGSHSPFKPWSGLELSQDYPGRSQWTTFLNFACKELDAWAYRWGLHLEFFQARNPTENVNIKSLPSAVTALLRLDGRLSDLLLNAELFLYVAEGGEKLK